MMKLKTLRVTKDGETKDMDILKNESFGDFELWYAGAGEYKKQRGFTTQEAAEAELDGIRNKVEAAGMTTELVTY